MLPEISPGSLYNTTVDLEKERLGFSLRPKIVWDDEQAQIEEREYSKEQLLELPRLPAYAVQESRDPFCRFVLYYAFGLTIAWQIETTIVSQTARLTEVQFSGPYRVE